MHGPKNKIQSFFLEISLTWGYATFSVSIPVYIFVYNQEYVLYMKRKSLFSYLNKLILRLVQRTRIIR